MGSERFERYLRAFDEEPPVSIRLNPAKAAEDEWTVAGEAVPWCRHAYYLAQRPNFTFDPLFHAGCYYVQEAASMFLDEVIRQQTVNSKSSNCKSLDLCAAPGGKSTLLRAALPADSVLYSNEPVRSRAAVLLENVQKWGYQNHHVTNLYPRDYRKAGMKFDLILCDVPCSGEGMFRKDPATIGEWSLQNVERCQQLQRDIVGEAWQCLNDGGILVYSTCTFNTKENEENIRWMLSAFDAEVMPIATQADWHITGSLLPGFTEPVYRFIPGITRSEGLFMCVLRKGGVCTEETTGLDGANQEFGRCKPKPAKGQKKRLEGHLPAKNPVPTLAPLDLHGDGPRVELTCQQAIAYLRREALTLPPDTPRGLVEVCFMGRPLGQAKNIGSRANNLYPKEWKIKTTHIPQDYEAILRPAGPHPEGGCAER